MKQIHQQLRFRSAAMSTALAIVALSSSGAAGATFDPIMGLLSVRAGEKTLQTAPAVIGQTHLSDNDIPVGFNFATASLTTALQNNRRFTFSSSASSSTNKVSPPLGGGAHATANVSFQQSFKTTSPQWIQLTSTVLSPPGNPNVSAAVTLSPSGQPTTFSVGDSMGAAVTFNQAFPAGTYVIEGTIATAAVIAPSHAGAASGFVLIAEIADFNSNGVVGPEDLAPIKSGFGAMSGTFASGNLDGDGDTDGEDFLLWQRQLGTAVPGAAVEAVPEPAGVALGLLAGIGSLYCRTNRSAARRAAASPSM